jgi:hypothetical protein
MEKEPVLYPHLDALHLLAQHLGFEGGLLDHNQKVEQDVICQKWSEKGTKSLLQEIHKATGEGVRVSQGKTKSQELGAIGLIRKELKAVGLQFVEPVQRERRRVNGKSTRVNVRSLTFTPWVARLLPHFVLKPKAPELPLVFSCPISYTPSKPKTEKVRDFRSGRMVSVS